MNKCSKDASIQPIHWVSFFFKKDWIYVPVRINLSLGQNFSELLIRFFMILWFFRMIWVSNRMTQSPFFNCMPLFLIPVSFFSTLTIFHRIKKIRKLLRIFFTIKTFSTAGFLLWAGENRAASKTLTRFFC